MRFPRIAMLLFALAALFAFILQSSPAVAQQRSEKAAETSAENRASTEKSKSKEEKKEEEKGMRYRMIGPYRGGRSLTAVGIPGDPNTYYFGATGGGVWKSTDGALSWKPIFDHEGSSSIGSIAVAESDPNIVYVGTGEACIRGNLAQGDGVYKSLDGGKTWTNVGLKDTRSIGKVIINPKDPNIVFVAALGHPYGPNAERGIFRTTDGGKTWDKVLYKDENTGGVDIAFDPNNSNILFAALWQVRRTPWSLDSGGPGSGLYRSVDGGSTWKQLTGHGLPAGPWGKTGVAVGSNSERVYALIEAKDGGLYRSDDGGDKWELVNADHRYTQRAWYYIHVFADPKDPDTLYIMNVDFRKSTDGGHTFNKVHLPHGDNHGLWIDSSDTKRMIAANDGGVTVTVDGGSTWTKQDNQPTAQFYHVITDNRFPYYIYGAQQDNTTVGIASQGFIGGISERDWYPVGGGESGYIAPYPPDPEIVYAGEYQGQITRFNKHTGEVKDISVIPQLTDAVGAAKLDHRFQWTAPLLISPHDPNLLLHAGERIFETSDQGEHWTAISPDLTRNDKSKQQPSGGPITIDDTGTEYYDTIFAVAVSPLQKGLIWAGTDDGLVQITRDDGKNWTNITPKQMPQWSRVDLIEASPHETGTAYVAVDNHQNDDDQPYIFKTTDFGKSWSKITSGIPENVFVRAVREDPKKKDLLFAGTETGVFVSYDGGKQWQSLQLNLPTTPVHDLVIHDNDLVLATHGRSFWVLDDISPLRQYSSTIAQQDVHLYTPATAYRVRMPHSWDKPMNEGENPPNGAEIYFNLKALPKQASIEILDSKGELVRKVTSKDVKDLDEPADPDDDKPKKEMELQAGMNRFVWDLRYQEVPRLPNYYLYEYQGGTKGPMVLPGSYQVRLTVDGKSYTAPLEVKLDPREHVFLADLEKQVTLTRQIQAELTRVYEAVNQIWDLRAQTHELQKHLASSEGGARLVYTASQQLDQKVGDVEDALVQMKISANEDSLRYPPGLDAKLSYLANYVEGDNDSTPTAVAYQEFDNLKKQSDEQLARWSGIVNTDLVNFENLMQQQNVRALFVTGSAASSPGPAK
jgi:photosystem II stability/assembly factor-like uncharacterized protein